MGALRASNVVFGRTVCSLLVRISSDTRSYKISSQIRMLSIAIKNSILLALVILISHFLLKGHSTEDSPHRDHEARDVRSNLPTSVKSIHDHDDGRKVNAPNVVAGFDTDDLYSYVYGDKAASQHDSKLFTTTHLDTSKTKACDGMLVGYESASDHWAELDA